MIFTYNFIDGRWDHVLTFYNYFLLEGFNAILLF